MKNIIRFNGSLSAGLKGRCIIAENPINKDKKQYFEVYLSANNSATIGLMDKNTGFTGVWPTDSVCCNVNGYYGASYPSVLKAGKFLLHETFNSKPPNGKIYGMAISKDTFSVYYNGSLLKKYDLKVLGASTNYDLYPFMYEIYGFWASFVFNFGETPLAYKPPTGYISVYQAMNKNQLYLYNGDIFGVLNNTFTKLTENWTTLPNEEKKALFELTNHEIATAADLKTFDKFKILNYTDTNYKPDLVISAAPKDKIIFPRRFTLMNSFDGIDQALLSDTVSGSGVYKLIVTTDLKTYQTYDFEKQAWNPIDHTDLVLVKQSGIDAAQFTAISRNAWDRLLKGKAGLGIAYLLSIKSTADKCEIDKLAAKVDIKGNWMK